MLTLLGVILTFIPFAFIIFLKDKMKATLYFITGFFVFHSLVAVITQLLSIFNYGVVLVLNLIMLFSLSLFFHRRKLLKKVKIQWRKIPWVPIVGILIIGMQFSGLHFNYTGQVSFLPSNGQVENDTYTYPLYSDEWIAASFASHSIETGELPISNTLTSDGVDFSNLNFLHYSFLSEMFLILDLDPVSNFAYLSILSGLFICLSLYLLSRSLGLDILSSTVVMLLVPYITNGANIPGVWFLLPFIVSLSLFFIGMSLFYHKKDKWYLVPLILSFLFYPPLIVFILPIILCEIDSIKKAGLIIGSFLVTTLLIVILGSVEGLRESFTSILDLIVRDSFNFGVYHYHPQYMIPLIVYPFIVLGILIAFEKKRTLLLSIFAIGLSFWALYLTGVSFTFIIGDDRAVISTCLLLILLSGFGFQWFFNRYKDKKYISIYTLSIFLLLSFIYPSMNNWEKIVVDNPEIGIVEPLPPINRYLTDDDIVLFKNIRNKRFLSIPWKGLILGVYNDNYPLASKESILTINPNNYFDFMYRDCEGRIEFAEKNRIHYVYIPQEMRCPGFMRINSSDEGLVLYKYSLENNR